MHFFRSLFLGNLRAPWGHPPIRISSFSQAAWLHRAQNHCRVEIKAKGASSEGQNPSNSPSVSLLNCHSHCQPHSKLPPPLLPGISSAGVSSLPLKSTQPTNQPRSQSRIQRLRPNPTPRCPDVVLPRLKKVLHWEVFFISFWNWVPWCWQQGSR